MTNRQLFTLGPDRPRAIWRSTYGMQTPVPVQVLAISGADWEDLALVVVTNSTPAPVVGTTYENGRPLMVKIGELSFQVE